MVQPCKVEPPFTYPLSRKRRRPLTTTQYLPTLKHRRLLSEDQSSWPYSKSCFDCTPTPSLFLPCLRWLHNNLHSISHAPGLRGTVSGPLKRVLHSCGSRYSATPFGHLLVSPQTNCLTDPSQNINPRELCTALDDRGWLRSSRGPTSIGRRKHPCSTSALSRTVRHR